MNEDARAFLDKARQSMAGAEREYTSGAYDNSANRCYYAAYQAAISILLELQITTPSKIGDMKHQPVRAMFATEVIRRRKLLRSDFSSSLDALASIRKSADYLPAPVGKTKARKARDLARLLVDAVVAFLEKRP